MIIKKITLKNFFRYGPNEQILDLSGTGISGITGPNGYGKSTSIVDSLCFAFYGKYRCSSVDDVVNRYIGKDCKVGVEFEQDGKEYKILRYRKHSTHNNNVYIFQNDLDISGHTAADTNNKIIDIIRMPYIAFINSSVFSSELYSAFLANKVSERLVVFENILSLKEITAFYLETKEILKELGNSMEEIDTNVVSAKRERDAIDKTSKDYSNSAREKLLKMKADKDAAKKSIDSYTASINELSIVDIELERSKLSNNSLKEEYELMLDRIKKEKETLTVKEDKDDLSIIDKYKDVDFEENRNKELKYAEDLETIKARENGYTVSMGTIKSLDNEAVSLAKKIDENKYKLKTIDEKIRKLDEATCPFCGQHLTSERAEDEKKKAASEFEELKGEIADDEKKLEEVEENLKEERERYNYLISDANRIKEKLDNSFYPNTELIKEQYENALKNVKAIEELREKNKARFVELLDEERRVEDKLEQLSFTNFTIEELDSMADKIQAFKDKIVECERQIAEIDGQVKTVYDKSYVDGLNKQIEKLDKEISELMEKKDALNDDIVHYEFLADCFSNKSGGFKKYFIGEMIDVFNAKISQYLPFFFEDDVRIEFDKNLNDKITMDGYEISFNSFSQGQRQRAELAINFALFDVARIFFSNDNKLLILDEMDKGLDKFGIKAMIDLLNGFDKQLKIFVVSHNPLMEEEIDSKIKISRDENGFSILNA